MVRVCHWASVSVAVAMAPSIEKKTARSRAASASSANTARWVKRERPGRCSEPARRHCAHARPTMPRFQAGRKTRNVVKYSGAAKKGSQLRRGQEDERRGVVSVG